jgi:hypothetical protein
MSTQEHTSSPVIIKYHVIGKDLKFLRNFNNYCDIIMGIIIASSFYSFLFTSPFSSSSSSSSYGS